MSTHVKEHCDPPFRERKKLRLFEGMLWACDCGKVWRWEKHPNIETSHHQAYYRWVEFPLTKANHAEEEKQLPE